MTTRFATLPDHSRIAFDASGTGPALMLLHGGGGSRRDWHVGGYVERLKQRFTVIAVDLRGHGESDWSVYAADYTVDRLSQDLLAVADACRADRFALWGYSYGGNAGRYLAARSERVTRVAMLGNPLGPGLSGALRQMSLDFCARWTSAVNAQFSNCVEGRFDPALLSREDQADIRRLSFPAELLPSVLAWSNAMLDWPVLGPAGFRCPALWLIGSGNEHAMRSYEIYADQLDGTNVRARILEGMTHDQEFSEIDSVLPILLEFTWAETSEG